jgi:serine/threonine protein kinase
MADQRQREKCLREVDIMKKLNHPHIIQYIDSFIHNNELIIVTEWAEKGDLKKLIKEKESDDLQFDEPTIWNLMKQIASALKHMHEKRIMHRDLKPANIFISADNSLKIGDLGLGRSFSSETLEAYSKVGTPLYMSPELIQDSGYT